MVRYQIEFWIFRALSWILVVLPERAARALGSVVGWVVGVVLRVRRVDTERHLEIAFPERGLRLAATGGAEQLHAPRPRGCDDRPSVPDVA